jgi:hypothetical protein
MHSNASATKAEQAANCGSGNGDSGQQNQVFCKQTSW